MGRKGSLGQSRQVVHIVEAGTISLVEAGQQQVDMIWGLGGEGGGRADRSGRGDLKQGT